MELPQKSLEGKHLPVMVKEVLKICNPNDGGNFMDCTFGAGGYSKEFLKFDKTDDILKFEPIKKKWQSFGWNVKEINGHSFNDIENSLLHFKKKPVPTVIICRTIKGKGVSFMENKPIWHYRSPNEKEYMQACKELSIVIQ